jgi:Uncharacterized protein conserved in bacteria
MSRANVESMKEGINRIHGMLVQFVNECPDAVWKQTFGGFPVWQQAFHVFACYGFFTKGVNETPEALLFGADEGEVVKFAKLPPAPEKEAILKAAEQGKKMVEACLASLDDAALSAKHEGLSARFGVPKTNLEMLTILVGHGFYHLGACDSALRAAGHKGIM